MRVTLQRLTCRAMLASLALGLAALAMAACQGGTPSQTPPPMSTPMASVTPTPTVVAPSHAPSSTATASPTATPLPAATFTPTLAPSPTPTPSPTDTPRPTPAWKPGDPPPARDLYELARSLKLKQREPVAPAILKDSAMYQVGQRETFWVVDLPGTRSYQVNATLRHVTSNAYWWVADDVNVAQADLEQGAQVFEERIYPTVTRAFGALWPEWESRPHRLTVLHANLAGVGGYFSSVDKFPPAVHPYSNERSMIYINVGALKPGSSSYQATLAHELQHAIHHRIDPNEETWMSEGLAEVASDLAGYPPASTGSFLATPSRSLVNWPLNTSSSLPHYGGAFLFFTYLAQHYGGYESLHKLLVPSDGVAAVDDYLESLGRKERFRDLFRDWVVANAVGQQGTGKYDYAGRQVSVAITQELSPGTQVQRRVPQYAAEYLAVSIPAGRQVHIRFQGEQATALLDAPPPSGMRCWWGNHGDAIDSTLVRELDLSRLSSATLRFKLWYDIEDGWDYAYVEVSTDGGSTWDVLETPGSSRGNPIGNSFGPGYTGSTRTWREETVDLTAYAGRKVLLRFQYVTDDAIHGSGICLDDISLPELGFTDDAESEDGGWTAAGFLRAESQVPQDYIVQVLLPDAEPTVLQVPLDSSRRGELTLPAGVEHAVVIVAALAETRITASYTLVAELVE